MREIKFRAWDKENKCWFKPTYEAYKGNLEELLLSMHGRLTLRTTEGVADESTFSNRFELVQYTGLKDKNGTEIYEGDVVNLSMWHGNVPGFVWEPGVIKWYQPSSGFKWFSLEEDPSDKSNYWLSQADESQREIIGNIYENGDLLK